MLLKAGDTITDGYKTYAVRDNGLVEFISPGSHAEKHVTPRLLKSILDNLELHIPREGSAPFIALSASEYNPILSPIEYVDDNKERTTQ